MTNDYIILILLTNYYTILILLTNYYTILIQILTPFLRIFADTLCGS